MKGDALAETEPTGYQDMADKVTSEQRSRMMSAVHGSETLPELYVRKVSVYPIICSNGLSVGLSVQRLSTASEAFVMEAIFALP
jgi:G:T-mismatch repair DNA endonuclease (very short patch repair protein)